MKSALDAEVAGRQSLRWQPYVIVSVVIAVLTALLRPAAVFFDPVNIALLYLFPVLLSAVRWGIGPSFYAAGTGVLAFDFFFVPPYFSFTVADIRYVILFVVFITVATLTASLASRLRQQLQQAKQRESFTAALYALSRQMTAISDLHTILRSVAGQVSETMDAQVAIFLPDRTDELQLAAHSHETSTWGHQDTERTMATWVYRHGETAGRGTEVVGESQNLFVPLRTEEQIYGVLAVNFQSPEVLVTTERLRLIEALSRLAAVAISRVQLQEKAQIAHLTAESERLRTALLDSISHELRTPLATIIGSTTGLLDGDDVFGPEDRHELLSTIREGAMRMNRLVTNLLSMVRLESGMLQLKKKWCNVEEIIGVALAQTRDSLQARRIRVELKEPIPLLPVDDVLIEQVLVNVLSNAIKYSPDGSDILVAVRSDDTRLTIEVSDAGIGIPSDDASRVFDKFYRTSATERIPGTGLGLAICKGIVEAHSGQIEARSNSAGGASIVITLPVADPDLKYRSDFDE